LQCSEICGILHSSMPIVVESVSLVKFLSWLQEQSPMLLIFSAGLSKTTDKIQSIYYYVNKQVCNFFL
jgi:heme/copper-type cytochrome/quinol oxidase subunit 2